jgi:CheY-like chemotaxis protein
MDVRTILAHCARALSLKAREQGLSLHVQIDPRVPQRLLGDALRLRQVLLNLGDNAVKFTHAGEVRIDVQLVEQSAHAIKLRCEVADTGIGIAAERLDSLFAPFTQADTSATRRYGGTGLGLSIVRRLVQLMQGETGVSSEEGRGSRFWFTAHFGRVVSSADVVQLNPPVARSRVAPAGGTARVLIAEDNPVNQRVASRLLEKLGYAVDVVGDGRAAVNAWETGAYALVLMDCQMPELDGFSATREIRRLEALTHKPVPIPIVALTANAMHGTEEECLAAGMTRYLTKPIDRVRLSDTLAELIPTGT